MRFASVKQAIGWAVARRRPGLVQVDVDERVQTTAETSSGWEASAIYAAMCRAGIDPHGPIAAALEDWATKPSDAQDEADVLAAEVEDERESERLRGLAAKRARLVDEAVERVRAELDSAGLLEQRVEVRTARVRWMGVDGVIRTCRRSRELTAAEAEQTRVLDEVAAAPFQGPRQPARDLDGARQLFELDARELAEGRQGQRARTLRELDGLIAGWAGCSERRARAERLRWGAKGTAGQKARANVAH